MTAPATAGPSVDEVVPRAVELAETLGRVPSKDRLMKTFRIGRPKAEQVYRRVQMESVKRRSRRARRLAERVQKAPVRRVLDARVLDPSVVPVSPGVGPVDPWTLAVPVAVAEGVPTSTDGTLPDAAAAPLPAQVRRVVTWPALVVAAPAFVAIWAGWVAIGRLTGFGRLNVLPGFGRGWVIDTAITLPVGVEAYAAYAFYVALNPHAPQRARRFAGWSSGLAVLLGMGGQTAFHLMAAAGLTAAPWEITTAVSCLPVAVFGLAAALAHLVRVDHPEES